MRYFNNVKKHIEVLGHRPMGREGRLIEESVLQIPTCPWVTELVSTAPGIDPESPLDRLVVAGYRVPGPSRRLAKPSAVLSTRPQ